ncbi:hypothetical protein VNO77_18214 [Canavalia gladiata]|uniref:Importin subunit alpha n=1 Tax=Canavalia gladiata TaxID=3824 RepID=A0AAN9LL41_CANGL
MSLSRRTREDDEGEIRNNKRLHRIPRRRRDSDQPSPPPIPSSFSTLDDMIKAVRCDDSDEQLEATTRFKDILSLSQGFKTPIDVVDQARLIPCFVQFLERDDQPELQLTAAWALTNVACGTSEQTRFIADLGAVAFFVEFLTSGTDELKKEALWALGNIAGDSASCRDIVLDHGALSPLLPMLNPDSEISTLRIATWTLSNFCQGKPPRVDLEQVKPALPALQKLIHLTDEEIVADACWALSYLSDGPIEKIEAVVELGVCPRLAELLLHLSDDVIIPAIRTLGNIASGNEDLTQLVIDNQVLPRLYRLVNQNQNKKVLKEACWTISNITAGNGTQKMAVIEANLIDPLVHIVNYAEFNIRKEAAWAIANATSTGSDDQQIKVLVYQGCIQPLCDLLVCADPKIVRVCLEGLENILYVGEADKDDDGVNLFAQMVHQCGGLDNIEFLLTYNKSENYERSMAFVERFWSEEFDLGDLYDLRNNIEKFSLEIEPDLSEVDNHSDS